MYRLPAAIAASLAMRKAPMEVVEISCGVLLREHDTCVVFLPREMRLFRVSPSGSQSLQDLGQQVADHLCAGATSAPPPPRIPQENIFPIVGSHVGPGDRPRLHRLTLNISNACNLACSYCYADLGHDRASERFMSPNKVREVLARVVDLYGQIDVVHFFGGEPLMNLDAIQTAGKCLQAFVGQGRLDTMPAMVATTNGTWSQPEVLGTLLRWKMALTVSWDGPRNVHDSCRPTRHGAGSYELVAASIERFREHWIPFDIECTYNGHHRREGVSLVDLLEFFHEHTGQRIFHIVPAYISGSGTHDAEYIDPELLAAEYRRAARFSMTNLLAESGPALQFVHRAAHALATRTQSSGCPAFSSQLMVATDGFVYPCFMFAGDPSFRMGNLLAGDFPNSMTERVLARYAEEVENKQKSKTWYSALLDGCVAGEAIATGSLGGQAFAPVARAIAEECVFALATRIPSENQVA